MKASVSSSEVPLSQLPPVERACLTLLALNEHQLTQPELARLLSFMGIRIQKKTAKSNPSLDEAPSSHNILPILKRMSKTLDITLHHQTWKLSDKQDTYKILSDMTKTDREIVASAKLAFLQENGPYFYTAHAIATIARAAFHLQEMDQFKDHLARLHRTLNLHKSIPLPIVHLFPVENALDVSSKLPEDLQTIYLTQLLNRGITQTESIPREVIRMCMAIDSPSVNVLAQILSLLIDLDSNLPLDIEAPSEIVSTNAETLEYYAFKAVIHGDFERANQFIQKAWAASITKKSRKPRLQTPIAPLLTLVASLGPLPSKNIAAAQVSLAQSKKQANFYAPIAWMLDPFRGHDHQKQKISYFQNWQSLLISIVAIHHTKEEQEYSDWLQRSVQENTNQIAAKGFSWIEHQLSCCLKKILGEEIPDTPFVSLLNIGQPANAWTSILDAIEVDIGLNTNQESQEERLVWLVTPPETGDDALILEFRLQKSKGNGWTNGRNISIKQLLERNGEEAWMSPQDREIARCIVNSPHSGISFSSKAPLKLINHPRVFWNTHKREPIDVVRGHLSLIVDKDKSGNMTFILEPSLSRYSDIWFAKVADDKLAVYEMNEAQLRLANRIGHGLDVPAEGESRVKHLLTHAAQILPVHSDLISEGSAAEEKAADSRIVVELERLSLGLSARLSVYPLGPSGPRVQAGQGNSNLVAQIEGTLFRCRRNMEEEKEQYQALLEACPELAITDVDGYANIEDLAIALEILETLYAMGDEIELLWKHGKPISISHEQQESSFKMALKAESNNWFSASGSLQVDDNLVLDLKQLLEILPGKQGRYIQLDEATYLAISDSLLSKLQTLSALSNDNNDLKMPQVAAGLISNWDIHSLELDQTAKKRLKNAQKASKLKPVVPETLDATLRPYQEEGFSWMVKLAHWGAGACLADDMGLGKTIQTISVLLHRASNGPAIVIAPTSVCSGWLEQGLKFGPTLNWYAPTNAEDLSSDWGPYDVIVMSYTFLTLYLSKLEEVVFSTVVLDEAQAIKNAKAKRTKAACTLKADFRLATTGTPIENHLGELWSLMNFLNPGLLGTSKNFEKKFGRSINKEREAERLSALQKLIRPFILRRKKTEVLKELPSRTEIVIEIEPSPEEAAFMEALRQRAIERMQKQENNIKKSAMTLLAELTRLRQAACHPELVEPDIAIKSSKLTYLIDLTTKLVENEHRVLIFSQFVSFLSLVRQSFEKENISYKYLDGSTPRQEREKSIRSFQEGEADTFLISLKAGGTGLNLTGADYVIHLDPWWNPAVEDQASSRAHRIGQKRPVTVYKLVTKDSIEERVYALHGEKRDLAERVLMDADTVQTPDVDTLYALLTGSN